MTRTPLVVVPGRFSTSASALRYAAVVNARALLAAVHRAGGEPLTVLPHADEGQVSEEMIERRLGFADAVLLPGGGDVAPGRYGGQAPHDAVYDVDEEQDAFDLAVARWALSRGVPLLAICRGLQVVNIALGGTLEQHMAVPHHHTRHEVRVVAGSGLAALIGASAPVSCYHHQRVDSIAPGLRAVAHCADNGIEAVERAGAGGFLLGVQWHPEDTAPDDQRQLGLFAALIRAALR